MIWAHRKLWVFASLLFVALAPGRGQTASKRQMKAWRSEIGHTLAIPKPLPALRPEAYGTFSPAPGVVAERVTYGTEFGMRVPAIVYRPERERGRMPALVVVNGHAGDKSSWYAFYTGLLYARAGAVVLTYDPIGEGERNTEHRSGTREHDRPVDVAGYPQHLSGLMVTDVIQAVSYLRQRKDVDGGRIGVLGYSLGSFVSAIAGAYDRRIDVVVLSAGGDLDGPGGWWDSSHKRMCQAVPWQSLDVLGDRPAVIYALNQQRGPTLILNGLADSFVDIPHHGEAYFADLRRRVERITGTRRNLFETSFFPNVSHRPSWVTRPAALWLEQKLHFPRWTDAEIEAMPETHISEWARRNHVTVESRYLAEPLEGGVRALGNDIPGIPAAELNVLTRAQWEEQRDSLVYDAWVRHTLAVLSSQNETETSSGKEGRNGRDD